MPKYKVLVRMDGDRLYEAGDTRELNANDARHLVALGALEEVGGRAKAAETEDEPEARDEPAPRRGRPPGRKG